MDECAPPTKFPSYSRFNDEVLYKYDWASFLLSLDNGTVELRGGMSRTLNDVILSSSEPRPLSWVRLLVVSASYDSEGDQEFQVYRGLGCLTVLFCLIHFWQFW